MANERDAIIYALVSLESENPTREKLREAMDALSLHCLNAEEDTRKTARWLYGLLNDRLAGMGA